MHASCRPLVGLFALLMIVAAGLVAAAASSMQDEPAVLFEFSPAKDAYAPGENITMTFTVTNTLPAQTDPSTGDPVNTVLFTNISVHFSWMAPNVYAWADLSNASSWLGHGEMEQYAIDLTIPANATAKTYSYFFTAEYQKHTYLGDFPATWGPSPTYRDLEVASSSGVQDADGKVNYVPYLAFAAFVLAIGSIGAVLYTKRGRPGPGQQAPEAVGSMGTAQVPTSSSYPVIHASAGERFPIERGFIYLVKEQRPNISFAMFSEAVSHGAKGMLVVREHPNRLKQMHNFEAAKILWLTRRVGEDHIDPTELSLLSLHISKFIDSSQRSVVLLEGLEYLITQNDFESVLRFVNHLHDFVLAHDCAVVIVIDPRVLATRELALLERSCRIVEPGDSSIVKPDRLAEELEA